MAPMNPLACLAVACACIALGCKGTDSAASPPTPARPEALPQKTAPAPAAPEEAQAEPEEATQPASANPDPCVGICARSASLKCGAGADCLQRCALLQAEPVCAAELQALSACAVQQPEGHWECTEQGLASVKTGYCKSEQAALARCMKGAQ